ncbi:hypothetical protein ZWY2020_034835 [Hordeum vulgare]|nr:hypothetical protein ZWY2020_034835 [Hordeum vulgare]
MHLGGGLHVRVPPAPPPRHVDDTGTSVLSCILIIVGLIAFVVVASLSISVCLRDRSNRSRPSPPPSPLPGMHETDEGKNDLIDSLPQFTMASAGGLARAPQTRRPLAL